MSSEHKSDDLSFVEFGTADDCSDFADFSQVPNSPITPELDMGGYQQPSPFTFSTLGTGTP